MYRFQKQDTNDKIKTKMSTGLKRKRIPTYSEETLSRAIEDVKSGATLNVTSRKYKIPRTTLHSRVTNRSSGRFGPKLALSDQEELDLARWIEHMFKIGCSVSRNQISDSVVLSLKIANKRNPFVNKAPGKNWFEGFLRRRNLSEKIRENRRQYLKGIGVDGMNEWFDKLNDRLKKEDLHFLSRTRMYSIGEMSLPMHLKQDWGIKKGPAVLVAGNAAGQLVPPMIVLDSKDVAKKSDIRSPPGWSVEFNEVANMSSEILYDYVKNHLYTWLMDKSVQLPIVLFLYQQLATYLTQVMCEFCEERKIMLAILPSSPQRATTPIEIKLFPVLKKEYKIKLKNFSRKKRLVGNIGSNDFVTLLEQSLKCTRYENHLENSFYKCGLYPLSAERYIRACIKFDSDDKVDSTVEKNERQTEKSANADPSSVLEFIENSLDAETMKSFKLAYKNVEWTGKAEDTNLFYFWRKINQRVMETEEQLSGTVS